MARFYILSTLAALLLLAGCGGESTYVYDAQGAPYEIVVVADHEVWDGPAGDSIRAMFYRQYPMINRQETSFDVLRVLPSGFGKLNMRHRNVMITDIDPTGDNPLAVVPDGGENPGFATLAEIVAVFTASILGVRLAEEARRD